MTNFERALLSRGDDFRQRLDEVRRHVARPPKHGISVAEYRRLEELYRDLVAVVEAHELKLQLAKAMEPV